MSDPLHDLAEEKIRAALEAGLFDGLPGRGRPLELEDLSLVPAELRTGYMVLKSANVLPEELELKQSLLRIEDLLAACEDEPENRALERQRSTASLRLSMLLEKRGFGPAHLEYAAKLAARLEHE